MKLQAIKRGTLASLLSPLVLVSSNPTWALPPAQDTPEEVLRTEIILDARSPVDGRPMNPAEYAALQAEQQAPYHPPAPLSSKVRSIVTLLKVRKFIKTYLPFIPMK
ncbi:hypothetical protein [Leptodesmis sp.]|uniref:hypothetical protein n=1 Tax=Leptodesmis sp. TaxID=3100501 RepID=UPI00405358A1